MNIAIIGYGKMGHSIEQLARQRGHQIGLIIDQDNTTDLNANNLKSIDVAIEFSTPETAYDNYMTCFENNIPVVSGTTGWMALYDKLITYCKAHNQTFFYASNFSLGVNLFFKLNSFLAKMMQHFPEYNIRLDETHHIHKLDAPSGTAITLANDILSYAKQYSSWQLNTDQENKKLPVYAHREGETIGTHSIQYHSAVDTITIEHKAHNRDGFALGAVMAAEFIENKTGCFSMDDLLQSFKIF
jgi:4-hydroxy-tetrahydrodipicolinate reductase